MNKLLVHAAEELESKASFLAMSLGGKEKMPLDARAKHDAYCANAAQLREAA